METASLEMGQGSYGVLNFTKRAARGAAIFFRKA
jgi:hypothetical protein